MYKIYILGIYKIGNKSYTVYMNKFDLNLYLIARFNLKFAIKYVIIGIC